MPDAKHHVYSQPPTCKRGPLYVTPPGRVIRHAGARPLRRDPLTAQGRGARRPTPQPSAPADGLPPGTSWSRSMSDSPEVRGRDAMSANGRGAHVRLGQMLVQAGLVSAAALTAGLREHARTGVPLGEALVSLGHIRADHVAQAVARQLGLGVFDAQALPREPADGGPDEEWYRTRRLVPLGVHAGVVQVATTDPTNSALIDEVRRKVGRPVQPLIATNRDIERALHARHA